MSAGGATVHGGGCRCGRCGARYEAATFAGLAPVKTFAENDLADYVIRWPAGVIVDVRECAKCQTPIARLARAQA